MRRVMILGEPGSGKSTFARALGQTTGLPVTHLDKIIWTPGWVMRSKEETVPMVRDIEDQNEWIIDGFVMDTWPQRAGRADTLVWLDLPLGLRLWRVIKRLVQNFGRVRPDMTDGCPEQISREFIGFLVWMVQARTHHIATIEQLIASNPHLDVIRLQNRRQVASYLEAMQ